jgi:PAS domain S-box-containing protein
MWFLSILPDWAHTALDDAAIVLGVTIASITVFKFPYRRAAAWLRTREGREEEANRLVFSVVPELQAAQDEIRENLHLIALELKPNHGTSLRDAINRIEAGMEYNRALFRGFIAQEAKPMYITDATGNMTWCNTAYADLTNRDTTELMGRGYWGIVEPSQLDELRAASNLAVADKRDMVLYFNVATGDPDWPLIPVEATAVPILDRAGDVTGWIGSLKRLDDHYNKESV